MSTPDTTVLRGTHDSYDVVFLRSAGELHDFRSGEHTNKAVWCAVVSWLGAAAAARDEGDRLAGVYFQDGWGRR